MKTKTRSQSTRKPAPPKRLQEPTERQRYAMIPINPEQYRWIQMQLALIGRPDLPMESVVHGIFEYGLKTFERDRARWEGFEYENLVPFRR